MSSHSRVTRSKGKLDGLNLPARKRPRRKPTNMENDDGNTVLNTTFNTGSDQHHTQMPVHTSPLQCQSTPPRTDTVKMCKTPVPAVPTTPHRLLTPCIPLPKSQDSSSSLSQMSARLFTEDRYSSSFDDDLEVCDAEITLINRQNRPNQTFMHHSAKERPSSTPTTIWITQPRVIQTKRHHPHLSTWYKPQRKTYSFVLMIFSFQMVATDTFTRSEIRSSTLDT